MDESRDRTFVRRVAHDLNSLLAAILGSTALLLEQLSFEHPGREEALEIRRATMRCVELVGRLDAGTRTQS